jgi:hypothetical protein
VITNTPSALFGQLLSNGKVVLVNQSGITVGAGALVDTAGFTASAVGMTAADAIAGRLRFAGSELGQHTGVLRVEGNIVSRGGDVVLIAPTVEVAQSGVVEAANGSVTLAAGQSAEITGRGLEGITLQVQAKGDQALNLGTLKGDAVGIFAGNLKHSGLIQATAISTEGGRVRLAAQGLTEVAGAVTALGPAGKGGSILVSGDLVMLESSAVLRADGANGGGEVLVGGGLHGADARLRNASQTVMQAGAQVSANATAQGDGGTVVLWSDLYTQAYGSIAARAGVLGVSSGGNGGFVEVSGKRNLAFHAKVDVTAGVGGLRGTLLLDPEVIRIVGGIGSNGFSGTVNFADAGNVTATESNIYESELEGLGAGTNIVLEATRQIKVISTFMDGQLTLPTNSNLTLHTRNGSADVGAEQGIDLVTGSNLGTIVASGTGTITAWTGTGSSPQAADIKLPHLVTAGGAVNVTATGSVFLQNVTTSGGALTVAGESIDAGALLTKAAAAGGAGGNMSLTATAGTINTGALDTRAVLNGVNGGSSGNLTVDASSSINIASIRTDGFDGFSSTFATATAGDITISSSGGDITLGHTFARGDPTTGVRRTGGTVAVTALGNLSVQSIQTQGALGGDISLGAGGLLTVSGHIDSDQDASTTAGHIAMQANDVAINSLVNAGEGDVTITANGSRSIGLGNTSSDMTISGAELQNITAANLFLVSGTANTGTGKEIVVNGISAGNSAGVGKLTLTSDGAGANRNIRFTGAASTFRALDAQAGAGIFIDTDVTTTSGVMRFDSNVNLRGEFYDGTVIIGNVNLSSAGLMSFVQYLELGSSYLGAVTGNVSLQGGGITLALLSADQGIGTVSVNATSGTLTMGPVNSINDLSFAGSSITLNGNVNASGQNVSLLVSQVGGMATQTGGTAIVADGLELKGAGGFNLNNAGNSVNHLAAASASASDGAIIFNSGAGGLDVGTVNGTTGITRQGGVTLTSAGQLTVSQAVSASNLTLGAGGGGLYLNANLTTSGHLTLSSVNGSISQSGGSTLTVLGNTTASTSGSGDVSLGIGSNVFVGGVSVGSARSIGVHAQGNLNITGLSAGPNYGIDLQAGGTLTLPLGAINAGHGGLTLVSGGGGLTTPGTLIGGHIILRANGPITLAHALTASDGLELDSSLGNGNITQAAGATISVTSGEGGTDIYAGAGDVTLTEANQFEFLNLTGSGTFNLTNDSTSLSLGGGSVGSLDLTTGGNFSLSSSFTTSVGDFRIRSAGGSFYMNYYSSVTSAGDINLLAHTNLDMGNVSLTAGAGHTVRLGSDSGLLLAASATLSGGANWLTYLASPTDPHVYGHFDPVVADFRQVNAQLGTAPLGAGNGSLFSASPYPLTGSLGGAVTKVYDGGAGISLAGATAVGLSGGLFGETSGSLSGLGHLSNVNVGTGKAVSTSGATLVALDANGKPTYGYIYSGSGNIGTVTPMAQATWTGAVSNAWNVSSNWDVSPFNGNVLSVFIPTGASVVYDAAAGSNSLQSIISQGSFSITGGSLNISQSLTSVSYSQSGGMLYGAGSLTVDGSFVQTGGQIDMGGAVAITQHSGDLTVGALRGASINLTALAGSIRQTDALVTAGLLSSRSQLATQLNHGNNQVAAFMAHSSGSGHIELTSVGAIDVQGIEAANGNIVLNNTGGISTSGAVLAPNGSVSMTANSPLTIGTAGISASGNINLLATNLTSPGNMVLNGNLTSSAGAIAMAAAGNMTQNSVVNGALGVSAQAGGSMQFGPLADTLGSPISYQTGGNPIFPPGAGTRAGNLNFLDVFLDRFEDALVAQNPDISDPLGRKKDRDKDIVVVEGETTCKP